MKHIVIALLVAIAIAGAPHGTRAESFSTDALDNQDRAALDKIIEKNQAANLSTQTTRSIRSLFSAGGYSVDAAAANLPARVGRAINILFAVSGTIFLCMVLYSGIRWMTADGDSDEVKKAKKRIVRASIGLLIMLSSWILVNFVLRGILGEQGSPTPWWKPGGSYTSPGGTFEFRRYQ